MAPHEMSAVADGPERPDPADPLAPPTPAPRSSRLAISRGRLLAILAVLLPAVASLLAAVLTEDIAYHIRTGQLMLEAGELVDTDPYTFTALGEPWLNQQWAASIIFAVIYDAAGWLGLLLLRAGLIGLAFGLVYLACRATEASQLVSALVTMGAFVVAATNLALRSQLFGIIFFAAVVAILAWRRRYPLALWLIPLIMLGWANTHGSFVVGWAALLFALVEDLAARRRLTLVTASVAGVSVLATLVNPWGPEMWAYVVELSGDPVITALVSEWQAPTLRTPTGIFFYVSLVVVSVLLLVRGRVISWLQLLWLGGLVALSLLAVRNVVWWAIAAAPVVAMLVAGLRVRERRVGDPAWDAPRGVGYGAIVGLVVVLGLAALPVWRASDPLYGPAEVVQHAPEGVTEALRSEARAGDRLYAAQRWGSWFELALPGVPVMVDTRIELFEQATWADYLDVAGGRADWADILDRWEVSFVALETESSELRPFIEADPRWELLHEDDEGVVYGRADPAG